jgi:kumamolisin
MLFAGSRSRLTFLGRVCFVLSLIVLLAACGGGSNKQAQQATPTPSVSAQFVPFNLGIPQNALQSQTVGKLPDTTPLHVIVTFNVNNTLLKQLGSQQKIKAGQGTDVANLANQLGITNQQYQQLKQYFGVQNISVQLNKLHTSVTADAPAASFAKLLNTTFVYHQYQGRKFFTPATPIMLPKSIAGYIKAISGLDNYSVAPKPQGSASSFVPLKLHLNRDECVANENVIFPQDVQNTYGLNQLYKQGWYGQGTTIVLPELNSFSQSDIQHYLSCVNFRGKISMVTVDNTPPTTNDIEPLIDLEMVAGLAPYANIVVYQTDAGPNYENFWSSMQDILNQISTDYSNNQQSVMVSVSWGGPEKGLSQDTLQAMDTTFQTMTQAEHLNVFVSTGDCGAYASAEFPDLRSNQPDVQFPSSDPNVVGVGGTNLSVNSLGMRSNERVWSGNPQKPADCENQWGSGGGLSTIFKQPGWQQGVQGIQNQYSDGMREIPDVSAVAYNLAGYFNGQWGYLYGTSAAAPIWASTYALINEGLVSRTHYFVSGPGLFYWMAQHQANQQPFYDVEQGNNLYYPATAGYDCASGLGSPNALGVYNALTAYIQSVS